MQEDQEFKGTSSYVELRVSLGYFKFWPLRFGSDLSFSLYFCSMTYNGSNTPKIKTVP